MSSDKEYKCYLTTQAGKILLVSDEESITGLNFVDDENDEKSSESLPKILQQAKKQLEEYFSGERQSFDNLKLKLDGTDFQKKVWNALTTVPFGETDSYGGIAEKIGNSKACRAVGGANNKNPIAIIVPCHRIVGANGSLTGYAGGIDKKKWLLEHEKSVKSKSLKQNSDISSK